MHYFSMMQHIALLLMLLTVVLSRKGPSLWLFRATSNRLTRKISCCIVSMSCEWLGRDLWEKVAPLCSKHVCSHLCHPDTLIALGGLVSAPAAGPPIRVKGLHTQRKKNKGHSTPRCVIHTSVQTGCGRIEGFPWARLASMPLSLPSCPHPLFRRRNRRLSGPTRQDVCLLHNHTLKLRLSSRACRGSNQSRGAQVASLGTAGGSLSKHASVEGGVRVGWRVMLRWMAVSLWMAGRWSSFIQKKSPSLSNS